MNARELFQHFDAMARRDMPWVLLTIFLLGGLAYMYYVDSNHEQYCDDRYHDFVVACYEATGAIPSSAAYNLSYLNVSDRFTGKHWTDAQGARP